MNFTERSHAFIPASFYKRLTEAFGERGRQAFIHGTRYYGEQRGRRMAQRAIRDGRELDFEAYLQYSEWLNSDEAVKAGSSNVTEVETFSPDMTMKITRCAWHAQFRDSGMTEAGAEYCRHLDMAICRGFNPGLVFEVHKTLQTEDCCIHVLRGANFPEGARFEKIRKYVQPFDYHCGHSYKCYSDITTAIFGAEGATVNTTVLDDFRAEFGGEMADRLLHFRNTDFNSCR